MTDDRCPDCNASPGYMMDIAPGVPCPNKRHPVNKVSPPPWAPKKEKEKETK